MFLFLLWSLLYSLMLYIFLLLLLLLCIAITDLTWLSFELCMLIILICYYHDIVMLTIIIMITIGYDDNQLTITITQI